MAKKARTAEARRRLRTLAAEILARARSPDGLWETLPADFGSVLQKRIGPIPEILFATL
jgi:alpha-D-ribose 1-methylphosphonate 5-triphosphate synthase subunit PhnL